MRSTFGEEVREAFAAGGSLARTLAGFEFRPGQLRLAMAWADALAGGEILMAEAGTGSGKTLAYLIPSILSGRKTVVSTGTKTLQQQIVEKDVPLVREVLQGSFSCVVVKGRGNYLCRRRWKRFVAEPLFEFPGEAGYYEAMCRFAETTRTGDISECPGIPDDFHAWSEVNARSETCDTSSCQEIERCFLTDVRRLAQSADLVVVNHHLYFADLAIRRKKEGIPDAAGKVGGERGGEVLPLADAVIFDEAHGIEETASSFFGMSVSLGRALELVRDLRRGRYAVPLGRERGGKILSPPAGCGPDLRPALRGSPADGGGTFPCNFRRAVVPVPWRRQGGGCGDPPAQGGLFRGGLRIPPRSGPGDRRVLGRTPGEPGNASQYSRRDPAVPRRRVVERRVPGAPDVCDPLGFRDPFLYPGTGRSGRG
jgi:hypothetical protein